MIFTNETFKQFRNSCKYKKERIINDEKLKVCLYQDLNVPKFCKHSICPRIIKNNYDVLIKLQDEQRSNQGIYS